MTDIYVLQRTTEWEAWFADGWGGVARGPSKAEAVLKLIEQYPDWSGLKVIEK